MNNEIKGKWLKIVGDIICEFVWSSPVDKMGEIRLGIGNARENKLYIA